VSEIRHLQQSPVRTGKNAQRRERRQSHGGDRGSEEVSKYHFETLKDAASDVAAENKVGRATVHRAATGIGSGRTYDKAAKVWAAAIERERAKRRQAASSQSDNLPKTIDAVAAENKVGRATVHRAATGIGSGRTYDKAANLYCHSTANRPETGRHQRTTRSRRE
jgi:hypothetical protein